MATERADLVIAGTKRVTVSFALRASLTASPPSEIARLRYRLAIRTIISSQAQRPPRLIWRTIEVTIKPLVEVDETFCVG